MKTKIVFRGLRLVAALVLIGLAVGVGPTVFSRGNLNEADRAKAWAEANASRFSNRLDEIRLYPVSYQQALYQALPAEGKLAIWREYLAEAADTEALSETERGALAELGSALSASDFQPSPAYTTKTQRVLDRLSTVLGSKSTVIAAGAWRTMVPRFDPRAVSVARVFDSLHVRAVEALLAKTTVSAQGLQPCQCWVEEAGLYNCAYQPGYWKSCSPNTPNPPYLCQIRYDAYSGPCSFTETRPCNGMCTYTPVSGGGGGGGGGGGCDCPESSYCDVECSSCCDEQY